jgi:urocanate hydratase
MLIDGSQESKKRIQSMLFWDVNNGVSRRSWARNKEAKFAITRAMKMNSQLKVTMPNIADDDLINSLEL